MKCRGVYSAAVAVGVLAIAGYSHVAKADTITVTVIQDTGNAPVEGTLLADDHTGSYVQVTSGSVGGVQLSPYNFNNNGTQLSPYSVIAADSTGSGSATFNLHNVNFFDFLWGSPDPYNAVTFYSGADGTGTELASYTGASLSCFTTVCGDTGFALTQFIDTNGSFGSVVLSDPTAPPVSGSGSAAFEFGTAQGTTQLTTPLPGALALFAGGLGLLGLVGRRKRRAGGGHRLSIPGMA